MCNQASLDLIDEVVDQKVNQNEMFTAFDVSLAVKELAQQRGVTPERHRHMKGAIHQAMDQYTSSGLYARQLHDVGAPTQAFLYLPAGADPNNYVPQQRKDAPQPATTPAPAPTATSAPAPATTTPPVGLSAIDTDDGDQTDTVGRKPDQRGTLTVPNYLLRAAGFQPKDVAYVTSRDDGGEQVLVLTKRATTSPITTYTVDYATNVRVTNTVLGSAGIGGTNVTYDFDGAGDEVVVRKHK